MQIDIDVPRAIHRGLRGRDQSEFDSENKTIETGNNGGKSMDE